MARDASSQPIRPRGWNFSCAGTRPWDARFNLYPIMRLPQPLGFRALALDAAVLVLEGAGHRDTVPAMAERSFTHEVGKLAPRRRTGVPRRGHPRGHQGAAAVRRRLCRRLPGRADLASHGRAVRCAGAAEGARHPLRSQRLGGRRRRDARRVGQLSDPRRGDLEIHRRHQRRLGCAGERRVRRRHRRRAGDHRRGLRRRLLDHAGALARLRDEVADVAARSAAEPGEHRGHGGARLRAVGGVEHAGHAGAAHPRVSRVRIVHRRRQPQAVVHGAGCARQSGARRESHRAAAGELSARAGEDQSALAGGGGVHRRSIGSTSFSAARTATSASSCRVACTTR